MDQFGEISLSQFIVIDLSPFDKKQTNKKKSLDFCFLLNFLSSEKQQRIGHQLP